MRPNLKLITLCFFMFPALFGYAALNVPNWDPKFTNLTFITFGILIVLYLYIALTNRSRDPRWFALYIVISGDVSAMFMLILSWRLAGEPYWLAIVNTGVFFLTLLIVQLNYEKIAIAIYTLTKGGKTFLITITILTFTFMPASYGSMRIREATGGLEVMNVMMSVGFISFAIFFIVFWHPLVIKLKNPDWRAQDYRTK